VIDTVVRHYRIRERLGAGGMGEVYRAEDTRLGRDVAIKFLLQDSYADADRRARFLVEARAASALRSAHVAAIYDLGEHEGGAFLVMEYVEGEPLSARIARGAIGLAESVDIALQVTDALGEAHGRGIVHRDVKSANIMITPRGQVKVLDFGLAKILRPRGPVDVDAALTAQHTLAGVVLGTVAYMSPEQARGREVDARSDLFSLGVVLYEMLAGRLPFQGSSFAEIADAILNHVPPPLARFTNAATPQVEGILRKALEKNPEFRYQSARDIYIDLHALKVELEEEERHRDRRSSLSGRTIHALSGSSPSAPADSSAIAVITFTNITREPSDEWIGSGIAETVTADLKIVEGVTVIGRERVFDALRLIQSADAAALDDRFAIEIGRGLGARWIVAGGYQRFGDQLRITARVVEVATGAVLRNVKIDGRLAEIFALQDRIVFELTQGLHLQLKGATVEEIERPQTRSIEAYELYSRGMMTLRLASRDGPDRAIGLFEQALALDANYAEAWAGLSGAYQLKGTFLNIQALLEKAVECAERAIALDAGLADAHTRLGTALLALGRIDDAVTVLRHAVEIDPRQARPWSSLARAYWLGKGDLQQGIEALERAVAINPQLGYGHLQLAFLYTETGDYDRAEAAARRAVDLQERYMSGEEGLLIIGAHTRLGYALYRRGRFDEAVKEYQSELVFLAASDHVLKERSLIEVHQKLGAAYLRLGQAEDAERHLKAAIRGWEERVARGADDPQTRYYAAIALALRGDLDRAAKYIAAALESQGLVYQHRVAHDPDLEGVRARLADLEATRPLE
jgi:serine/threonine protein kinase/Tfp pilus assembly protein PilF